MPPTIPNIDISSPSADEQLQKPSMPTKDVDISSISMLISNLPKDDKYDDDDATLPTVDLSRSSTASSHHQNRRSSTGDNEKLQRSNSDPTAAVEESSRRHSTTDVPTDRRDSMGLASFSNLSKFLAKEGLIDAKQIKKKRDQLNKQKSTSSILSNFSDYTDGTKLVESNEEELNEQFTAAVHDFALQLKFYGKDCMDEECFNLLLDDIGYKRSRDGLFDDLLNEVLLASPSFDHTSRSISVEDMQYLYMSEPYKLSSQAAFNNGEALMSYVENLFRKADVTGDNVLDKDELKVFLTKLFEGKEPSDEELNEALKVLDVDGDGSIDWDEFKSFMLKANVNELSEISDFNENLLSPSHTSEEEFVTALENYTKSHRAVNHHLLTNLATASFGKKETADMLLRFLSAYSQFNSGFISNVETLLGLLDNKKHAEILMENLEEEMGEYDEETMVACEEMGIPRESVENIPHSELFKDLLEWVETVLQRSYCKFIPSYICEKLKQAISMCQSLGKLGLLAALYFGSELIVPEIYSSILAGLKNSIGLTNEEARFLILHIDMDQDHAEALREIIIENCLTKADRLTLANCTKMLLDARVSFYDNLIKYSSLDPMARQTASDAISYDSEAEKPNCMSDFTARPVVFEMCKDHVKGSTVLDVGCGEGFVARKLINQGAIKTVGVDINSAMVETANSHSNKTNIEYYVEGDVSNLKETLLKTTNQTNLMPGAGFDQGMFDLSVAVFVFNYLTITDMNKTFKDVFSLLKPGGHFVFSVPHPFMSNHDGENFGFVQQDSKSNYFALRDQLLSGHVSGMDGDRLKIGMYCKTFEDYIKTARKYGFEIVEMEEARVSPESLSENPAFFESVNGVPLHLVIKLRKPTAGFMAEAEETGNVASSANSLNMLPKKITWSKAAMRNPQNSFFLRIPDQAKQELYKAALECYNKGISVEELDLACDFPSKEFASLKSFAVSIRNVLLHETGLVVLQGLDLDVFGRTEDDEDKMVSCSKIAYYLLCNHVGAVDGSARGRLFDVKDNKINALGVDNVLFSVSNCEANWHTDGASKDRVYDAVSLLCIHPSSFGGKSKVSNACNAYDQLSLKMPKFLMNELHRPVSRDILENGKGNKKVLGMESQLSRAGSIMTLRISYNSYPIFETQGDRMRFRYMRFWIESAHKKMYWKLPTLLRIAMDVLDDTLDEGCCFHEKLKRGDIIICNNACVAHARDSFKDLEGDKPRHLVRAWMQVQKVDLLKPSNHQQPTTEVVESCKTTKKEERAAKAA